MKENEGRNVCSLHGTTKNLLKILAVVTLKQPVQLRMPKFKWEVVIEMGVTKY